MNAVYGRDYDSLLLVNSNLWVINGEWQIEKRNGLFFCQETNQQIDIKLLGYIDYDGDYNSTLERFRNGEGQHTSATVVAEPEMCKKKYYGIECSCSKCKR
jgi:hypothetical protein